MFLIIPVGVQYTARRYPVVTFTLMGINVALYLISFFLWLAHLNEGLGNSAGDWFIENMGLVPADRAWYTFFTSMFVHAGFWHLLGNMIYLFLFGSCVEDTIGRWQYVLFYLAGGLGAALVYMLMIPSPDSTAAVASGFGDGVQVLSADEIPMVGASGAISACIGGFLLLLAKTKINFRYILFFFFRFFSGDFWLPVWLVVSFWFLTDLFWAIVSYNVPEANDGTAFAAHVGGTLTGLAMMGGWKVYQHFAPTDKADTEEVLEAMDAQVVPDPVDDEPPTVYLSQDGNQLGPFTRVQVAQMRALGSVRDDAFYWQEGMADWENVSKLEQS